MFPLSSPSPSPELGPDRAAHSKGLVRAASRLFATLVRRVLDRGGGAVPWVIGVIAMCTLASRAALGSGWSVALVEVAHLEAASGPITGISFRRDGRVLAFGSADDIAHVWTIGAPAARKLPHGGAAVCFVASHRSKVERLLTMSRQGAVNLYDPKSLKRADWISRCGHLAATSPRGRVLVGSSGNLIDSLTLWPLTALIPSEKRKSLPRLEGCSASVVSLAVGPGANLLMAGGTIAGGPSTPSDGYVLFWDRVNAERPHIVKVGSAVLGVTLNGDATLAASVGYDGDGHGAPRYGRICIWDTKTEQRTQTVTLQQGAAICAAFQPGGNLLVTSTDRGQIACWDPTTLRMLGVAQLTDVRSIAFSPRGRRLAVGTAEGAIFLYAVQNRAGGTTP